MTHEKGITVAVTILGLIMALMSASEWLVAPGVVHAAVSRQPALVLQLYDIFYEPKTLDIPANSEVTLQVENDGVVLHSFSIDVLGISVDVPVGEKGEVVINAPAGTYS